MVALKLEPVEIAPGLRISKQERRGGIETPILLRRLRFPFDEAGTPWWH